MRTRRRALALPLLLVLGGCQGEPELRERPLLDGRHEPDVLVESRSLELPPSTGGNRFLTGWYALPGRRGLRGLVPAPHGSRVELVNLKPRRRSLTLLTEVGSTADGRVALRFRDRELGRQAVSERIRLSLPADLPLGRVAVDVDFHGVSELAIRSARLRPVVPSGEVLFQTGAIVQSPWSAVDFVQDFSEGAVLLGGFQPPRSLTEGQGFAIAVETGDRQLARPFEWSGEGAEEIRLELPAGEGPIRVRLEATGGGDPGRWVDLRVAEPPLPERESAVPAPPRIVVLYVFDALRADHVGHLGGPEDVSPTLDRLAAEGVTFSDHLSVAPNTKPSVKSLFIGRPFLLLGHRPLPDDGPPTIAESFTEAGYRTIAVSGSPWVSSSFGTDRGFRHRSGKAAYRSKARTGATYNDSAERVHAAALEWMDSLEPGEPAFVYMHTMHPHNPYDPPPAFERRFAAGIDSEIDGSTATLLAIKKGEVATSEPDRERLRALYTAGMAYNDSELDRFIAEVKERYDESEVLIVFTSDHGEELFEHGGVLHGYTLYQEQLQIPLVFWWPGVLGAHRVDVGTDHLDLAATFQSLLGRAATGGHGIPLWELMTGSGAGWPKPVRFAAASSVPGGIFMARTADLKLIWAPRTGTGWGMGQGIGRSHDAEYLFDLRLDPSELENRAGLGGLEADWLRARLAAWVERGKLEEVGSDAEEVVDEETLERLRALGYVD